MDSKQLSSGPGPQLLTPRTLSSGLVPNPPSPTPYVLPIKKDWDTFFQPMFDEYFNPPSSVASSIFVVISPNPDMLFQLLFDELLTPPPSVDHPALEVIALITEVVAPEPTALIGSPSSKTVDQDAPSLVTDIIKGIKSKQNRTKPSTKQKAWRS
nr:hypothetical protein [Tanacetum cinerariifolium]